MLTDPQRHLALGLAWAAAFAVGGLAIFQLRTRRHGRSMGES